MFRNVRIFVLFAVFVTAACATVVLADEGDQGATEPAHVAGFFETHYFLTEIIVLPIIALMIAGAMASNTTTQAIKTEHWDFWKKSLGTSYTYVPVFQQPSSPTEIKNTLKVLGVIYLILRLTCLSGFFTVIYQSLGCIIDSFLR